MISTAIRELQVHPEEIYEYVERLNVAFLLKPLYN
jgi:hypothetical protein